MEKSDPPIAALFPSDPHPYPIPSSFHRRSRSDDMSMFMFMDPLISSSSDDLFSSFIDVDSLSSNLSVKFIPFKPKPPLSLFQRDTNRLSHENTELKLRLQAMEQQAQLRNALNEALRKEVERMKMETGEISGNSDSFDMGMHQIQYSPSTFMAIPPYHASINGQDMHMQRFNSQSVSDDCKG